MRAARKALHYLLPLIGPMIDPSADKMLEGRIAEGIGEVATNTALMAAGMRPKASVRPGTRGATVPRNPAEADAVAFARQEGIPLDAGTATGSQFVKNVQKKVASSWGGASTAEAAQAAQGEALAATADRLARRANDGGPALTGVEAGESVRSALQGRVRQLHGEADAAYSRLREAESRAPEELVQARPARPQAAAHVTPEQSFLLRWLANDLEEFQFQPSSRMRGVHSADEWQQRGYGDADTRYAPRVSGTPVQEMFEAMGITGSRPEIAMRIERHLTGKKKDPRLTALADVLNEAWDGQQFDFDLVSNDNLVALGLRRRDLKSPIGLPNYDEAGAASFFPDYAIPEAPGGPVAARAGTEAQRLAIDLKPHKEALRPLFDQLRKEREIVGTLHGDKARAAVALESVINGPDFGSLTTVERALGPIKKIAAGAEMPQLRTQGQGVAARVAGELDQAVRGRAVEAGPEVAQSLMEGRAATRSKHLTAAVMKRIAPGSREPRAIFRALTAHKDAGIAKLRDLQRHAPEELPNLARALLEEIFEKPTSAGGFKFADKAWADWHKLGPDTKRMLFTEPGHVKALDRLFLLAKKIGENPNPSGTAQVLSATGILAGLPSYALAQLLYTPGGVRALTSVVEAWQRPGRPVATGAARTAALAQLSRAAREAGVTLEGWPKAADSRRERPD